MLSVPFPSELIKPYVRMSRICGPRVRAKRAPITGSVKCSLSRPRRFVPNRSCISNRFVGRIGAEGVNRRYVCKMAGYGFASNPPYRPNPVTRFKMPARRRDKEPRPGLSMPLLSLGSS